MLVSKKALLLGPSVALCVTAASAQTQGPEPLAPRVSSAHNKLFRRASAPRQVTLDLHSGTYTRGPVVQDRGETTITDLANLDALDGAQAGWVATDTGGGLCTWFSNASKGLGVNQGGQPTPGADLMSSVLFYYCSGALDVISGGVGGSVELGFYEGYTVFGGAPTTPVVVLNLTGMPANTAPGGILGASRCHLMDLRFNPLVAFAGNISPRLTSAIDGTVGTF